MIQNVNRHAKQIIDFVVVEGEKFNASAVALRVGGSNYLKVLSKCGSAEET